MKRILIISILLTCLFGFAWTQVDPVSPIAQRTNKTFAEGEYLLFRVHYGLITAGFASIEVAPEAKEMKQRPCYHIIGKGWTSSGFDIFYKVRDTYESFVDQESLLPLRFNRHIVEGKFESYTEVHFDQHQHIAYYTDEKKNITPYPVPESIQDVISAFYFARATQDQNALEPGDRFSLRNFIDRKTFGLEAELVEREVIKVEGVEYQALHMKLLIEEAGLITDGSKIEFWISDDENKIPLRIQSDLAIGSLKADLIEARGLSHPFDAKL